MGRRPWPRPRAATIDEIKRTALALMRERGTVAVRFAEIARAMGLTAPALYRYFADREELLDALAEDAAAALTGALERARAAAPRGDPAAAWLAAGRAYRRWAHSEPHQFALVVGRPPPGRAAAGPADLYAWASLHGFTALEASGHFAWLAPEARDALFEGQLRLAACSWSQRVCVEARSKP